MKAIRVNEPGDPEVLLWEDVETPVAGAGQVLVRLEAVGVNPVETYVRSGKYPNPRSFPYTPGTDGAGVVAAVGPGVRGLREGQRVYLSSSISGTYAEFALCEKSGVHLLPDSVSAEQGAALGVPYATAYRALVQRGKARAGETVFVHGASGGVGIAALQLASAMGLEVTGSAGTPEGIELIEREGAAKSVNHAQEGYLSDALGATCGRGFDLILEMAAHQNLGHDLELLAPGGRVVVIGSRGGVEVNPRNLMTREANVLGMTLMAATPAELVGIHAALVAGLSNRTLRPIVGKRYPLAQAADAHTAILESGALGKMVLLL